MDNEIREEVKSFLRKALISLEWQEDETAIEYIREVYDEIKNYEEIAGPIEEITKINKKEIYAKRDERSTRRTFERRSQSP